MSTEVVDWKEQMANEAKAAAALERPQVSTISLKSGVMSYQETPVPGNKMPCVVIGAVFENRFYKTKFNPNKPATPDCFALSLTGEDMVPHPDSPEVQAERCTNCSLSEWNSDLEGGKGKACKEVRKLIIVPAQSVVDGLTAKAEMAIISIPVMSVKNWKSYVNGIAAEHSRPPWAVFTEISVVPDPKSQFRVQFACLGLVADDFLGALKDKTTAGEKILMQPYVPLESTPAKQAAPTGKKY